MNLNNIITIKNIEISGKKVALKERFTESEGRDMLFVCRKSTNTICADEIINLIENDFNLHIVCLDESSVGMFEKVIKSTGDYVEKLKTVVEKLNLTEFDIVGYGEAIKVVMEFTAENAEKVKSTILVSEFEKDKEKLETKFLKPSIKKIEGSRKKQFVKRVWRMARLSEYDSMYSSYLEDMYYKKYFYNMKYSYMKYEMKENMSFDILTLNFENVDDYTPSTNIANAIANYHGKEAKMIEMSEEKVNPSKMSINKITNLISKFAS